ncbi:MAG: glycoside hydrolase family 2 TIM barrel-domain containing protein [Victivallales bacterium]
MIKFSSILHASAIRAGIAMAAISFALAVQADTQSALSDTWRIQPAKNSSTLPDEKDWGTTKSADWRWGGIDNKGKGWEKTLRKDVNSLWYEQSFKIPQELNGKRFFLDFRRIEGDAIVFMNGEKLGELLRPGGEIEISAKAKPGEENSVRVFITRDYTDISRNFEQDRIRHICRTHEFGAIPMDQWAMGITAPVKLISRPRPAGISDVFVQTSWRNKEISIEIEIDADSVVNNLKASAEILDADGSKVLSLEGAEFSAPAGRSTVKISSRWENPKPWELDAGYLYTAKVKLIRDGSELDAAQPVKFGFREIWADGRKLIMNGHPSRWRLLTFTAFIPNVHALSFFRLIGYNASIGQANPTMWWRNWSETPVFDGELLDEMDKTGFAVTLPVPAISYIREKIYQDEQVRMDFEREMSLHLRRYRNHPSVMGWSVGMNTYNPRDAISPQGMGRRYPKERVGGSGQPKAILTACDIVKKFDPTRLAYSHADGNIGDLSTSNTYLNFAPLQEREEWPMAWNKSGDMPVHLAEFGQPETCSFWKSKRLLLTEYISMYFGEHAYKSETDAGLAKTVELSVANKTGFGCDVDWDEFPAYWDFQRLFVRNTNRAYRTWDVNGGWAYWVFDGYGNPPGFNPKQPNAGYTRYAPLKEKLVARPSWANPNFDIYSQANKPLLAYVAGSPRHTDKTHTYFSKERVEKTVAIVWDGPGECLVEMDWSLLDADKTVQSGKLSLKAASGEIKLIPFSFDAPSVDARKDFSLTLKIRQDGKDIEGDSFNITVFPRQDNIKLNSKTAIIDPTGKSSSWLKAIGVDARNIKAGDSLKDMELLIIGREALKPGDAMPYTPDDIRRGLKVLVLEQKPDVWQGLGFRTNEAMPRRVFANDTSSPVLKGLSASDLFDWRGSPDLLPEEKNQPAETLHAPKWTNTHGISSSVPQIPRVAGFTPILSCEFDMDYSPLLEWRSGRGMVVFSALDFSGRVGVDPAATLLARNLISFMDSVKPVQSRRLCYAGDDAGLALLKKLGVEPGKSTLDKPLESILIIGGGESELKWVDIEKFASDGGQVFLLPQTNERLAAMGFKTMRRSLQRVKDVKESPAFRSVGLNLLRWREPVDVDAFVSEGQPEGTVVLADGLAARRKIGKGCITLCQVSPSLIDGRHADDKDKAQAVDLSVYRLEQLVARLLTNAGTEPSDKLAARLSWLDLGPRFEILNHWNILGPYFVERDDGEAMLKEKFPGEESAVIGDTNPNPTFKRSDGKMLDWRPTIKADEKGFVNLGDFCKRESLAVAYAATLIESEVDREAVLRVGCDWRMRIWVNGEEVFKTLNGANKAAAFSVKIHLKKGENAISMKVASGSKGFGFYADLSKPVIAGVAAMSDELKAVSLYAGHHISEEFDPYEFHYW